MPVKSDRTKAAEIRRMAKRLERCAWGDEEFDEFPMIGVYAIISALEEWADMKSPRKTRAKPLPQPD